MLNNKMGKKIINEQDIKTLTIIDAISQGCFTKEKLPWFTIDTDTQPKKTSTGSGDKPRKTVNCEKPIKIINQPLIVHNNTLYKNLWILTLKLVLIKQYLAVLVIHNLFFQI